RQPARRNSSSARRNPSQRLHRPRMPIEHRLPRRQHPKIPQSQRRRPGKPQRRTLLQSHPRTLRQSPHFPRRK
ncbi:MAG: hypothetical protein LQ341_007814, partial [Variospora aurantia]